MRARVPRSRSLSGKRVLHFAFIFLSIGVAKAQTTIGPREGYQRVAVELETFIEHELADKQIPAISIALVDDRQVLWAEGFGLADPANQIPAGVETKYRVGPLSALFTGISIMQLVEKGELDLDAPITDYVPAFQTRNPSGRKAITLRELMSHRAGLVREPPVGNYFDSTGPGLPETINSLARTALVYAPGERVKYSNAGIALAGYVVGQRTGRSFAEVVRDSVLEPMGMNSSGFELSAEVQSHLAKSTMWSYDGWAVDAPTFQLGEAPAAGMYSTVLDLGRFVSMLLAHGRAGDIQIIKPASLREMWAPQFVKRGDRSNYGLGFRLSSMDGHRLVGQSGQIYGFSADLEAIPDSDLGVVTITTMDGASAVVNHISLNALRLALAARSHRPKTISISEPLKPQESRSLAGRYVSKAGAVDLIEREGELFVLDVRGGPLVRLRKFGDELIVDDKLKYGPLIQLRQNAIELGDGQPMRRVNSPQATPIKPEWTGLIGEYGWDYNVVYILEKNEQLTSLVEWHEYEPLEQLSRDRYRYSHRGPYDHEDVTFKCDRNGFATQVKVGGVVLPRRAVGPMEGEFFRIKPLRPVEELRTEALKQEPPQEKGQFKESDLVDLTALDSTIKLDIRYATNNDFLSTPVYEEAKAFMQRPAAEALVRVQHSLQALGYGILIYDAYRPWYVTKIFWEATPDDKKIFVANPARGSLHNRGCAVDLTLYDIKSGKPINMGGSYDEMSERSFAFYPGGTSSQHEHRDVLRNALEREGFRVNPKEWWHFDYKNAALYPIGNETFEQITLRNSSPKR